MIRWLYETVKKRKQMGRWGWSIQYKINKLIANIWVNIVLRHQKGKGIDEEHELIVSLTTFPQRIDKVWMTIATLMNQTYRPKRIILWLAEEQFPKEKELPRRLLRLKNRGLEIRYCEDLKPHKKYFYTMMEYPDEIVVTVDDDTLYPENHLQQLWETHQRFPNAVCCQYAHRITYDSNGRIEEYSKWDTGYQHGTLPSLQIMPVGCGGVLYPSQKLYHDVLDKEKINRLCSQMDDLWLKTMEALNGTRAVVCNEGSLIYFGVLGTKKSGLQHENAGQKKNDAAMRLIVSEYPQMEKLMYDDYLEEIF